MIEAYVFVVGDTGIEPVSAQLCVVHRKLQKLAGVVHRGEFVSPASTVADPANRAVLEYMQRGGSMRGYAGGGYVSAPMYASAAPVNTTTKTEVHLHAHGTDPGTVTEMLLQRMSTAVR